MFFTQISRVVRLMAFLLLGLTLHLSAKVSSQTVTYSGTDVPLKQLFSVIREQTGVAVFYDEALLQHTTPVDVRATAAPLLTFLQQILHNQPLAYTIKGETIFISAKEKKKNDDVRVKKGPPVTGVVRGPDGNPVAGANVQIKGTNKGVVTDANGKFSIEADNGQTLVISNVGFTTKEIKVNGENNLIVDVAINASRLDEVQFIAYGQTSRRLSTGNTGTVKAEDIAKQPINNPLLAISGRVPGIQITQQNGLPGGGMQIRVQGQNSLLNGNAPLFVVDGVPFPLTLPTVYTGGPLGESGESTIREGATQGIPNALAFINPSDIESINILKDADATAIYGSRAANGAILITTRKGKSGKTTININIQNGWGKVTRTMDVLNRRQYLDMRYEAFKNDGLIPSNDPFAGAPYKYAPDLTIWDTTRETNWVKDLIGGTSQYAQVNAGISGGTQALQYLISGTFQRETTVFPGDYSDRRGSLHFNLGNSAASQRFHFDFSGSFLADDNKLPQSDLTDAAFSLEPVAPSVYNSDGLLNWAPNIIGQSTWTNPIATYLFSSYRAKSQSLVSNFKISYNILSNLVISLNSGYSRTQSTPQTFSLQESIRPEFRAFIPRAAHYGNTELRTWIIQPQLNYKLNTPIGRIEALLGTEFQESSGEGYGFDASGFNNDLLLRAPQAATFSNGYADISKYRYNAFFGRLNYNVKDKYILNINVRRDGTSRFGPYSRFSNFGSIGGAWIFSEEPWMSSINLIDFGKIKASYGTTGNDQIGSYTYLDLYTAFNPGIPYQGRSGLTQNAISSPYLEWEENRKLNLGVDLGFFKERVLLTANYFINRSSNQLLNYQLPLTTGYGSVYRNLPALIQNSGLEITLNTTNLKTENFSWITNFNLTVPRNKLLRLDSLATNAFVNRFFVGQPLNAFKVYHSLGVDPTTGLYIVADSKGEPTSNPVPYYLPNSDATILINTNPRFYGGFQNLISYKGFQLDFLFQFVKQIGRNYRYYNSNSRPPGSALPGFGGNNQPESVLDRWQKDGDIAAVQKYSTDFSGNISFINFSQSDAIYVDASYIRLKNVSFSWELPNKFLRRLHLPAARFYTQGQNLLTLSGYSGNDPETQSINTLPPLRVYTVGVQVSL